MQRQEKKLVLTLEVTEPCTSLEQQVEQGSGDRRCLQQEPDWKFPKRWGLSAAWSRSKPWSQDRKRFSVNQRGLCEVCFNLEAS